MSQNLMTKSYRTRSFGVYFIFLKIKMSKVEILTNIQEILEVLEIDEFLGNHFEYCDALEMIVLA